jgi:hypothetical protein
MPQLCSSPYGRVGQTEHCSSSAGLVTGLGCDVPLSTGSNTCLFLVSSGSLSGEYWWLYLLGVNWPRREAEHSPPSIADMENCEAIPPLLPPPAWRVAE